jgi:hypothetical protein
MPTLEVSAHLRVRPGQLEGFKKQAAECIRITNDQDIETICAASRQAEANAADGRRHR